MAEPIPDTVRDRHGWLDVKLLDEQGKSLSQWEIDFCESLLGWLRAGKMLSAKQRAKLDALIDEKVR